MEAVIDVKTPWRIIKFSKGAYFSCNVCEYGTNNSHNIKRHSLIHIHTKEERRQFFCDQCDKKYTTNRDLIDHIQSKHEDTLFLCNLCTFRSNNKHKFQNHYNFEHMGMGHKCNRCGKIFPNKGNLINHIEKHHKGNISITAKIEKEQFECQLCTFKSSDQASLSVHFEKVHDGLSLQCNEEELENHSQDAHPVSFTDLEKTEDNCDESVKQSKDVEDQEFNSDLKMKMEEKILKEDSIEVTVAPNDTPMRKVHKKHTQDSLDDFKRNLHLQTLADKEEKERKKIEECKCSVCGYIPSSKTLSDLKSHLKVHQGETREKFVCPDCGKILLKKDGLKYHMDSFHNGVKYSCNICDFQANSKWSKLYHINKIHKQKKFLCHICEYVASCKGNLKQHIDYNHSDVQFPCDQCEYKGKNKGSLRVHVMSVHEKIRFTCTYEDCKESYSLKSKLKQHEEQEHKEMLKCYICLVQASSHKILKEHIDWNHRGLKFSCHDCDFKTTKHSQLAYHRQARHSVKKHICSVCNHKSTTAGNLKTHIRNRHSSSQVATKTS